MPITVNEGGTLYELSEVSSNEGGTLYDLDTVYSNEGGTLYEIHSGYTIPTGVSWSCSGKNFSSSVNSDGTYTGYLSGLTTSSDDYASSFNGSFTGYPKSITLTMHDDTPSVGSGGSGSSSVKLLWINQSGGSDVTCINWYHSTSDDNPTVTETVTYNVPTGQRGMYIISASASGSTRAGASKGGIKVTVKFD